jgi:hypothetical protein
MPSSSASDMDSPWKEAVEHFLGPFLELLFPAIHKIIDWSKGYVSLDKELHRIVHDANVGKRLAEKLIKVWRKDGQEVWLLIHVEVQGQRDEDFAERMFVYNYRTFDRYRHPVASLAVLCDADPNWKPAHFGYNVEGCEVGIRFLVAKLLDYDGRDEELEQDSSPIAAVVLAHLKATQTRKAPIERQAWKLRLIKSLYERGLNAGDIRQLFRLLDWMLVLPRELEQEFRSKMERFEEERNMPYVTSIERLAMEEGHREGLLEGIKLMLEAKFAETDKQLLEDIRAVTDLRKLRKLARGITKAKTAVEVRRLMR